MYPDLDRGRAQNIASCGKYKLKQGADELADVVGPEKQRENPFPEREFKKSDSK